MKIILSISLSLLLSCTLMAQGLVEDVITFSRTNYGGTTRILGLGGTQVSLGGDISSATSNPAGLGFIRSSGFTFTPSINIYDSEATYLNNTSNDFKPNFNFGQLGLAISNASGDISQQKFKGGTFAINMTRTNSFHSDVLFEGRNNNSSIIDFFIDDRVDGGAYGDAAFGKLLITDFEIANFDDDNRVIETNDVPNVSSIVEGFPNQTGTVESRGAEYQVNFSWGGNYDDQIYFGAGLGVKSLRLERIETFTENNFRLQDGSIDPVINALSLEERRQIDGTGVNLNFGVIIRPVDIVRFGVSYTTPTFYGISEESEFSLGVNYNDYQLIDGDDTFELTAQNEDRHLSDIQVSEYDLRTPGKLSLGAAFFLNKMGFVSADVDFVNYTSARISSNDFSPAQDNTNINTFYQNSVINYRLGGELRVENLRFRAGYAMNPSALNGSYDFQGQRSFSLGGGYRNADYYVDIAYVNTRSTTSYIPYSVEGFDTNAANITNTLGSVSLTLGFNF